MNSKNVHFECIKDCSQCCIEREYYPNKKFGKIGVLILPEEKKEIEKMAKIQRLKVKITPRIGISNKNSEKPTKILAYQMMGKEENGNTCPFLDTESDNRSPNGGFTCRIYHNRPLACRAYPVIESEPLELDAKCKFCQECGSANTNLDSEIESLVRIKEKMSVTESSVWRFATGVGEEEDREEIETGWILE